MLSQKSVSHVTWIVGTGLGMTIWAKGPPDFGEEKPEEIGNFGGGADRRSGVANGILLFDGDGRPDVLEAIDIWTVKLLQEQAGVGGERLNIPPWPLGEGGIEGRGELPGAGPPGNQGDLLRGNSHGEVLEIL